jgi:hypothetical protein
MTNPIRILTSLLLAASAGIAGSPAQANAVTGMLSGHVITDGGEPAANVLVHAARSDNTSLSGRTGADGSYRFDAVEPGQYRLRFSPAEGLQQYAPGKKREYEAAVFEVGQGRETVVNETILPRGDIAGRFVDFDGSPIAGAWVSARDIDGGTNLSARTDANGQWRAPGAYAGRYEIRFDYSDTIRQAAFGKAGRAEPDLVTVAAGTTTTVDDTAIARTGIRVSATDSVTGAPVLSFSASAGLRERSTGTGELLLDGVQAGVQVVRVDAEHYFAKETEVTFTLDGQAELAVTLVPQAHITVKVVDAATGAPLEGICVGAFNPSHGYFGDSTCGRLSDVEGNLRIGFLTAGTYQLFATPGWGAPAGYGAQWVGATGGTGRQLLAKSFAVGAGQTVTGPVITLDRAGSITGRVSNPDGTPARQGAVGVLSGHPISGSSLGAPINEDGSYTIDFLGPYDWPLLFQGSANQWSGQVGDRHFARHIKVTSGATVTYDFRFKPGVTLTVNVPTPVEWILFFNAITGDLMGADPGYPDNVFITSMVGPQLIKLQVWPPQGDPYWAGGADFAHARTYLLPSNGSKTIGLGS